MKKLIACFVLLFVCLLFSTREVTGQNINVAGALVGNGTYPDLNTAFTAINSGAQTGASIIVSVVGNTTETATATLNQGTWTTLSILPLVVAAPLDVFNEMDEMVFP